MRLVDSICIYLYLAKSICIYLRLHEYPARSLQAGLHQLPPPVPLPAPPPITPPAPAPTASPAVPTSPAPSHAPSLAPVQPLPPLEPPLMADPPPFSKPELPPWPNHPCHRGGTHKPTDDLALHCYQYCHTLDLIGVLSNLPESWEVLLDVWRSVDG